MITSKPATKEYREGWDRLWGKKQDPFEAWCDWHQREEAAGNTRTVEEIEASRRDEIPPFIIGTDKAVY